MSKELSKNQDKLPTKFEGDERGYVTLPYTESQFTDFITGLLGKQQNISKNLFGIFEIDTDGINNLHYKLSQRIFQQNEAKLIQSNFSIVLDDNSIVNLKSFEEFATYNETKPNVSVACHITWIYLIKFRDKDVLEKQTINVSILTPHRATADYSSHSRVLFGYQKGFGTININIEHTARTWGIDIETLFSNHFESILKKPQGINKYLSSINSDKLESTLMMVFLLFSVISTLISFKKIENEYALKLKELSSKGIEAKIDFLTEISSNGLWSQYLFFAILLILFSLFVAGYLSNWIKKYIINPKPSFLLLTKKSYEAKDLALKYYSNKTIKFITSVIIAIFCSLIANYIFIYLTTN